MKNGDIKPEDSTLARVHVPNTVRDVMLADMPDDTGWNMQRAIKAVAEQGSGVIVLIAHSENAEDHEFSSDLVMGNKTLLNIGNRGGTEMNLTVGLGSQLLRASGVRKMRLMSSPVKYNAISGFDLEVVEYMPYKN